MTDCGDAGQNPVVLPAGATMPKEDVWGRPLHLPGATPPEASAAALDRIFEAWALASTINRDAAEWYRLALKVAAISAPYGPHGNAAERIIQGLRHRLDRHLATVPDNRQQKAGVAESTNNRERQPGISRAPLMTSDQPARSESTEREEH